ncbi:hypothetical protein BGY98DRAFT_1103745 [Russula aff. rugulosa BPL654]|nr:hypothetical protein BGY98DRAFT_1103745 [Russula aff. rugulosa BPL654]
MPQVVAIALGSLQRLIALRAVSLSAIPAIIQTMNDCMSQGVDIQLRFSSPPSPPFTTKLLASDGFCVAHEGGDTAPIGHVHRRQGRRGRSPHARLSVTTTQAPRPTTQSAFAIFEGGERPRFIQPDHLQTFALELIKNILTNYHQLFYKVCLSSFLPIRDLYASSCLQITLTFTGFRALLLLQHHLFALLLKALSERSAFPLAFRGTRVVLLLLKQFSLELEAEAEVILTHQTAIKLIGGINTAMSSSWTVSGSTHEVGVPASDSQSHLQNHRSLDNTAEIVVMAIVSNVVRMIDTRADLSVQSAATKVQWCLPINLDKTDAPLIPEAYINILGMQYPVSFSNGLTGYTAGPQTLLETLNALAAPLLPPYHEPLQLLEALQDTGYVLTTRGAARPGRVPDYLITQLVKVLRQFLLTNRTMNTHLRGYAE